MRARLQDVLGQTQWPDHMVTQGFLMLGKMMVQDQTTGRCGAVKVVRGLATRME